MGHIQGRHKRLLTLLIVKTVEKGWGEEGEGGRDHSTEIGSVCC